MRIISGLLLTLLALPASAATLRSGTTLASQSVRLSDLFDGVEQDRAIGPGPDAGGRIIVEAPQLLAIARQFGVDWRPSNPNDRIALERPGHLFPREDAMAALRQAFRVAGISDEADLEVPGFTPPMVPTGSTAQAEVGQLDYNAHDGRFTAILSVTGTGMSLVTARLSGRVTDMLDVPIATKRLMPGDVVGPGDVQMGRLRASMIRTEVAQFLTQAVGMALRHPVGPGAPFALADLSRPATVEKGKIVQMVLETAGLSLLAQGIAMDSGAIGERVRVLNPQSRAMIDTEVIGSGRVRVSGTPPVILAANAPIPTRVASR